MTKQTGGCLCGNIRFAFESDGSRQFVCHCRMCQRASGSAFAEIVFVEGAAFALSQGAWKSFQSSDTMLRHFCPECGSPVCIERTNTGRIGVLAGSLDDQSAFQPSMHICMSSAQQRLKLDDALPVYGEKAPNMGSTVAYDPATGKVTQ
jgi:hypothetical protein